jgi:hypothetical protein
LHEGIFRRVIIENENSSAIIDTPLVLRFMGALLAPKLAAIGTIAVFLTHGTIVVEKDVE